MGHHQIEETSVAAGSWREGAAMLSFEKMGFIGFVLSECFEGQTCLR